MRTNTVKFYRKVQDEYKVLYEEQRIRHDDVIQRLMEKFYKSEVTIYRILRTELPDKLPPKNPAQIEMFQ